MPWADRPLPSRSLPTSDIVICRSEHHERADFDNGRSARFNDAQGGGQTHCRTRITEQDSLSLFFVAREE
jgi:hypothetical protein